MQLSHASQFWSRRGHHLRGARRVTAGALLPEEIREEGRGGPRQELDPEGGGVDPGKSLIRRELGGGEGGPREELDPEGTGREERRGEPREELDPEGEGWTQGRA